MIDYARLHAVERSFAIRRAAQLEDRPVSGSFDLPHLRAIHGFLFQDVFPWAGGFRVVNVSKGGSNFGRADFIESALSELLGKLKTERFLTGLSAMSFASRAAFYLGEINAIHPFREGNGRTQLSFAGLIGVAFDQPLELTRVNPRSFLRAMVFSYAGDLGPLIVELRSLRG